MKHENDVSNTVGCVQVVRIYSFTKEIKLYIQGLHYRLSFCQVGKLKNFLKEIKHVLPAFIAWWSCLNLLELIFEIILTDKINVYMSKYVSKQFYCLYKENLTDT